MTDQTKLELIKSFAYGATVESLAEDEGMDIEELGKFFEENIDEIEARKTDLVEEEWVNE